jgi:hypothetical protein
MRARLTGSAGILLLLAVLFGLLGMHQLPGHHGAVAVSAGHGEHAACEHSSDSDRHDQVCEARPASSSVERDAPQAVAAAAPWA